MPERRAVLRPGPEKERLLWLLACAWTGVIYSTLYVQRLAAEFLRARNLLRLSIGAIFALVVVAVLIWAIRRRLGPRSWAVLGAGALVFAWGVSAVSPVEVKLHFVQYGVLGALVYLALAARGSRWAVPLAIVLTGLVGWGDEGIQYLLPNRWYDIADVGLNAGAGALAIATLATLEWARARDAGG